MDANGHVNNAVYFTYFEQVRISWLESVGMQKTLDGEGPVVVQTGCTYATPIPYPETLDVRLYGADPGRSSFRTYYEIVGNAHQDIHYASGEAVMVWIDRRSGKPRPLPDELRTLLAPR